MDQPLSPAPPQESHASGRLVLHNPGTPPVPLPTDVDLDEALARIRPGGYVLFHASAGATAFGALVLADDPRMRLYETGVQHCRLAAVRAAGAGSPVGNYVQHIETAHFHFDMSAASNAAADVGPGETGLAARGRVIKDPKDLYGHADLSEEEFQAFHRTLTEHRTAAEAS